jgi:hypothetical protein
MFVEASLWRLNIWVLSSCEWCWEDSIDIWDVLQWIYDSLARKFSKEFPTNQAINIKLPLAPPTIPKQRRQRRYPKETKENKRMCGNTKTADENPILSPKRTSTTTFNLIICSVSPSPSPLLTNFLCQQHYEVSFCFHDSFSLFREKSSFCLRRSRFINLPFSRCLCEWRNFSILFSYTSFIIYCLIENLLSFTFGHSPYVLACASSLKVFIFAFLLERELLIKLAITWWDWKSQGGV